MAAMVEEPTPLDARADEDMAKDDMAEEDDPKDDASVDTEERVMMSRTEYDFLCEELERMRFEIAD